MWWNAGFRSKLCGNYWSFVVGIEVCADDGYAIREGDVADSEGSRDGGANADADAEGRGEGGAGVKGIYDKKGSYTDGSMALNEAAMALMHRRIQQDVLVLFTERFDESARLLDVVFQPGHKPAVGEAGSAGSAASAGSAGGGDASPRGPRSKLESKLEVLTRDRYRCFSEEDFARPAGEMKVGSATEQ